MVLSFLPELVITLKIAVIIFHGGMRILKCRVHDLSKTINLLGRITIRNQISAPKSTLEPRENRSISRRSEKENWSYLAWREQKRITVICYTLKDNGWMHTKDQQVLHWQSNTSKGDKIPLLWIIVILQVS